MRRFLLLLLLAISYKVPAQIGSWSINDYGLPEYHYLSKLPYVNISDSIYEKPINLPEDPYFLIGNYKIKLFTHVSGVFRIITGQRSWMCMNEGNKAEYGANEATIENLSDHKITSLTGVHSLASDPKLTTRDFGCGYARYNYKLPDNLSISRAVMVLPSDSENVGVPAFEIKIFIKNKSSVNLKLKYAETVNANPVMLQEQSLVPQQRKAVFTKSISNKDHALVVSFSPGNELPSYIKNSTSVSLYDYYPPSLFFSNLSETGKNDIQVIDSSENYSIRMHTEFNLDAGKEIELSYVIGIQYDENISELIRTIHEKLIPGDPLKKLCYLWKKRLPNLENEKNPILYREMLWNAHALEAMATYNRYYNETFIPQGTAYTFSWGANSAVRDHLQHALGVVYYNPALARSIIRYVLGHITITGDISREETGYAFQNISPYTQSDSQLYLFYVLSEYLKVTGDYGFLFESAPFYPAEFNHSEMIIDRLQRTYDYFISQIGTGKHGLVKLLNADWNDDFFTEVPSNLYFDKAESHLNSLIAIIGFSGFMNNLDVMIHKVEFKDQQNNLINFKNQLSGFTKALKDSFYKDLGNRSYSARAYFNYLGDVKIGVDQMYIEPQGFLLQLEDYPVEKKKILLEEIQKRLIDPEPFAGRCLEHPVIWSELFKRKALIFPGYMSNGAVWFSTYAPVVVGAATFDKEKATGLLLKMTMARYADAYPQFWPGQWSFSDCIISSLGDSPGAPQWNQYCPVYCAHPHAWALYSYFKIRN